MDSSEDAYNTTPSPNVQRTYWKTGQEDCKTGLGELLWVKLNLLDMTAKHNPQYLNNMNALRRFEKK